MDLGHAAESEELKRLSLIWVLLLPWLWLMKQQLPTDHLSMACCPVDRVPVLGHLLHANIVVAANTKAIRNSSLAQVLLTTLSGVNTLS